MRFDTMPQSPIPFIMPRYVKAKRQDKLRPTAFPHFFIGSSSNCPRDTLPGTSLFGEYRTLPKRHVGTGTPFHSRLSRKCGLYTYRKKGGEEDSGPGAVAEEDVDREGPEQSSSESSESIDLRPSASETSESTASVYTPSPVAFPCKRASPVGMRSTAAAMSVGGAIIKKSPDAPLEGAATNLAESYGQSIARTPLSGAAPAPSAILAGDDAAGRTVSPDASVEAASVSEGGETTYSPSLNLKGRADHELRWLEEPPVIGDGRTHREQRQLGLDLAALMLKNRLLSKSSGSD